MKLFINSIKKTLPLIISCSLLFITTSDAVATSIYIPPGTTDEAFEEAQVLSNALGFDYMGRELITPYSEESVDLCLEAMKNKYLYVVMQGVYCLDEIMNQWDVPAFTLNKKVSPAVKALTEEKFSHIRVTRWIMQFKQLSSEEERLQFLRAVQMDPPPGEPSSLWEDGFRRRAVTYLRKMASDDAKVVLQDTFEFEQNRAGRGLDGEFIEKIIVSIDEIDLRQRLRILTDPIQQVAEIKSYILKHLKIAKRITEEEIKKTGKQRIPTKVIHHYVVWPIHKLGMIEEPVAIDALKEVLSDPDLWRKQKILARAILVTRKKIDPHEANITP